MILEDFFTLTEMKDGLTAPARVHELVSVMEKEKDCVMKNISDASRQWAAVASTISATESKDCLDLFIHLGGLLFIDRWLKDVETYNSQSTDILMEESITILLRALEKLQIDKERSMSSGIWITVNKLLDHSSPRVQDRAKALFDGWNKVELCDMKSLDLKTAGDASVLSVEKTMTHAPVQVPNTSASVESEATNTESIKLEEEYVPSSKNNRNDATDNVEDSPLLDHRTLMISISAHQGSPVDEKLPTVDCLEDESNTTIKPGSQELDATNNDTKPEFDSPVAGESLNKVPDDTNSESKDNDLYVTTENEAPGKSFCHYGIDDIIDKRSCESTVDVVSVDGKFDASSSKNSSYREDGLKSCQEEEIEGYHDLVNKPDQPKTNLVNLGICTSANSGHKSNIDEEGLNVPGISKSSVLKDSPEFLDQRKYDCELDYGMVDALEVARQVAQEVERQVVDYKEPSCSSSSEKILKTGFRQPGSPDSVSGKIGNPVELTAEDASHRSNKPTRSPSEDKCLIQPDNLLTDVDNGANDPDSSQATEVAHDFDINSEKCHSFLDLNQDVYPDELDSPFNSVSISVPVVPGSRPTDTSHAEYSQFLGNLGGISSSVTDVFHIPSHCKTHDSGKTREFGRVDDSLKQRQSYLHIDLNSTEHEDENVIEFNLGRQVSSDFRLNDSSSKSKRLEKPNLDLNRSGDDNCALSSDFRVQRHPSYSWNGNQCPSPASSSSSIQPSLRNFDLNDRPFFANDFSEQGLYHGKPSQKSASFGGSSTSDPVFSLFGAKVEMAGRAELSTKDFIPQPPTTLANGKSLQPSLDVNISRIGGVLGMVPSVPYGHSQVFGAPAVYGPASSVPYMLDSRGAPVVPQILGSSSSVPLSFTQQPFLMNMGGAPIAINGVVPSRPTFDLNSGFPVDGSTGSIRQLFMPAHVKPVDDRFGSNSQASSSSGVNAKRKEPDSGWDPYSLQYKHPQPPWR